MTSAGRRISRRAGALLPALAAMLLAAAPARAQPIAPPLVGGFTFSGPAAPSVTSIYYNPAAVGLLDGTNLHLAFAGAVDFNMVERDPIDPATGAPATTPGARAFAAVHEHAFAPGGFIGATSDLGTDNVTLGLAAYTPFYERRTLGELHPVPGEDGPTRYHLLELTLYHLYITPTVTFRVASWFYVGLGLDVVYSRLGTLAFDRDTALDGQLCNVWDDGIENDACAERIEVSGSVWSVGVPVGIVLRPTRSLDIGLVYRSGVFGTARDNVPLIGSGSLTLPGQSVSEVLFARTSLHLPHTVLAGVQLRLTPRWDLGVTLRWLHWPPEEVVDVRLSSATANEQNVPERVPLYRGYYDTFMARALAGFTTGRLRLGLGAAFATPSVDERAVSPATIDGWQLWALALAEVRLRRWLALTVGYGLRVMIPRDVTASVFDPLYQVDCLESGYDIPTCRLANRGRGVPTAAGSYGSLGQLFGVTAKVSF